MSKYKFLYLFPFAALAVQLLPSCSGSSYPKEIAVLDSISLRLDSAEAEVKKLDTSRIGPMVRQIEHDLRYVEVFYRDAPKDQVIDKQAATILSDYRSVRKPLRTSYVQVPKLKEDIDYSQAQIDNLIHDLKKDKIDKKDVEQYVRTELAEADKVIQNSRYVTVLLADVFPRFEQVNPIVRAYVDSLKAVEKTQIEK